ncbi:hypothetical protein GCM10007164_20390 [Luteimonas padinae]|uniref:site-specific DNA-methyltransferase (adenine-specific) n=1 Tax=Luteimonas padinae TaxID=1714359 RepID=A0ABV6SVP4_9GAMM|nr:N-6 DNA methylase [Luteimonas padinae]GHD72592.1 hypothetical protein GCM10007164_20390 [Luteimonas padinae]
MKTESAGPVLRQVQDPLREAGLPVPASSIVALQLIIWSYLSEVQPARIPEGTRLPEVLPHGLAGITEALGKMAAAGGLLGQAFNEAPAYVRMARESLVTAAGTAARLANSGMFSRFPAEEILHVVLGDSREYPMVSSELATLMASLAVAPEHQTVYCPWESTGQLVGELAGYDARLLVEAPWQTSLPALMALLRVSSTSVVRTDPLRNPTAVKEGRLEKFDACLSFPPMGMKVNDDVAQDLFGRFTVSRATSTGLMIQHIVAQTHGRAAIVVPNSFLFGPGKDRELREHLISQGMVEAVIALPAGIHQTTLVPTALLLLNTTDRFGQIHFVDASLPYFLADPVRGRPVLTKVHEIRRYCLSSESSPSPGVSELDDDPSLAVVVGTNEVLANDASLQVDRYVMSAEQRDLKAQIGSLPTIPLDDIATFVQPVSNKDRAADSPTAITVFEVGAADIPETGYIRKPEKAISIQLSPRRGGDPEDVFLRPYDLVLIVKGSVGKIGVVPRNVPPAGPGGWVAGQSAVVLRSKSATSDLRGLALWLRSPMGRKLLDTIRSGAAIQMLSINELRRLGFISGLDWWNDVAVQVLEQEDELQHQIEILQDKQTSIAEDLWGKLRTSAKELASK